MMIYLQQAANEPNPHPEALLLLGIVSLVFFSIFLLFYSYFNWTRFIVNSNWKMFVGDVYFHGTEGFDIDYPRALYYYKKAAKYGNAEALCNVV
jgi:TPR repeat protein